MSIAFRDISALATARRRGTTFESEKKKSPTSPAEKTTDPNISSALDALRAVLPATLITFYSTAVILLQNAANVAGADGRAAEISALTKTLGAGTPALEKAVKALTAEPDTYATWRVIFAAVWLVFGAGSIAPDALSRADDATRCGHRPAASGSTERTAGPRAIRARPGRARTRAGAAAQRPRWLPRVL